MLTLHVQLQDSNFIINASSDATLAKAIYLSGHFIVPPLCSGIGKCGHCLVLLDTQKSLSKIINKLPFTAKELSLIQKEQLDLGWRLGCQITIRQIEKLLEELNPSERKITARLPDYIELASAKSHFQKSKNHKSLAIDFGSTSVHCTLISQNMSISHNVINDIPITQPTQSKDDVLVSVNPQMGAGSDIMSRLAVASSEEGARNLSELSLSYLENICKHQVIDEIVLAANPAITHLILNKPAKGIATAPYHLEYFGGGTEKIEGLPPIWVAPLISPFIGGDISLGYASLAYSDTSIEYPLLLADMGTNGEFILAIDENTAFAASLPLGPALEGIGMECGTEAREGVITGVEVTPFGMTPKLYGSQEQPQTSSACPCGCDNKNHIPSDASGANNIKGISGTGYIELIHTLLEHNLLSQAGQFTSQQSTNPFPKNSSKLYKKFSSMLHNSNGINRFYLTDKLYMSPSDIEELLKIKASFSLAYKKLLDSAGLKTRDLKAIYLAGSLGQHCSLKALVGLGFMPHTALPLIRLAGNTSLNGARLLIEKPQLRAKIIDWCKKVTPLNLLSDESFHKTFAEEMTFSFL